MTSGDDYNGPPPPLRLDLKPVGFKYVLMGSANIIFVAYPDGSTIELCCDLGGDDARGRIMEDIVQTLNALNSLRDALPVPNFPVLRHIDPLLGSQHMRHAREPRA